MRARGALGGWYRLGCCGMARVEIVAASEVVPVALDLLLLAIHEVDVVAKKQVQVLVPGARELFLDGLELEQQIVSERAH